MSKKVIILIVAGLVLISFSLTLESAPMERKMMRHARFAILMADKNLFPAKVLLRHKDEIGLAEEQVTKIEKMQEFYQESAIRKQADIKIQELKFNSYLKKDDINRSKMEKKIRAIAKMKTDSLIDHINYLLDLKNLLTPEQIKKIEDFKKKRMYQRMEKREMRDRVRRMENRMEPRPDGGIEE